MTCQVLSQVPSHTTTLSLRSFAFVGCGNISSVGSRYLSTAAFVDFVRSLADWLRSVDCGMRVSLST